MSAPRQTCQLCGNTVEVSIYMRGFPPDTAKSALKRICRNDGCPCEPKYTAGVDEEGFAKVLNSHKDRQWVG